MTSMEIDEASDVLSDITTDRRGVVDDKNTAKKSLSSMERLAPTTRNNICLIMYNSFILRNYIIHDSHDLSHLRDEIVSLLDKIDNQVEELRREAVSLQEKRDNLMTKIDMMKHVDILENLDVNDRDDINLQLKRINERLQVSSLRFNLV